MAKSESEERTVGASRQVPSNSVEFEPQDSVNIDSTANASNFNKVESNLSNPIISSETKEETPVETKQEVPSPKSEPTVSEEDKQKVANDGMLIFGLNK